MRPRRSEGAIVTEEEDTREGAGEPGQGSWWGQSVQGLLGHCRVFVFSE